jgi:hypothetical protein
MAYETATQRRVSNHGKQKKEATVAVVLLLEIFMYLLLFFFLLNLCVCHDALLKLCRKYPRPTKNGLLYYTDKKG